MEKPAQTAANAWYKEPWAWFIICLPLTAITVSTYHVYLATSTDLNLVNDNYYREGKSINLRLEQDKQASLLNLNAELRFDHQVGDVNLALSGNLDEFPAQLSLDLMHPTSTKKDRRLLLNHLRAGQYVGSLERQLQHRWYVKVQPLVEAPSWRLQDSLHAGEQAKITLSAE